MSKSKTRTEIILMNDTKIIWDDPAELLYVFYPDEDKWFKNVSYEIVHNKYDGSYIISVILKNGEEIEILITSRYIPSVKYFTKDRKHQQNLNESKINCKFYF